MFASSWLRELQRRWFPDRAMRRVPIRRVRLGLECLEERLTPSNYTVTDASDTAGSASDVTLRYAINQAVSNKDTNAVIDFSSALAGKTLTLSQNDSSSANIYGPTAFVVNNAKIVIDGSKAPGLVLNGNDDIRLFAVTNTATLQLEYLTVEGGLASGGSSGTTFGSHRILRRISGGGGGGAGLGGAVYDDGGGFVAVAV